MTPCLSVVIPVYNAKEYLPVCLDTLLSCEGVGDTEIILVDDGSSDGSSQIADDYATSHSNIKSVHKENEGPSAARNRGLEEASGEYVFFCDADDTVVPELFGKIIKIVKTSDVDMIVWDSELVYETWNLLVPKNRGFFSHEGLEKVEKTYTGKELVETLLRTSGNFIATVWLGAYRRRFLVDNALLFEKGLLHEDELWVPQVYLNAQSVLYIPEKIYRYRIHEGSIMNPSDGDRTKSIESMLYIYPFLYKYYDEKLEGDPLKRLLEGNLTKKFVRMIYKFRIYRHGYGDKIDKKLLWRTAIRLREKIMILLLYVVAH